MNEKNPAQTIEAADSMKMLRAMVGIGIFCALMIVLAFEGTGPAIEKNKAEALEKAIFKVIPGMVAKQTYKLGPDGNFAPAGGEEKGAEVIYAGYDENGKLLGVAVEASGMGFADILRILYGYDPEKQAIVGFFVLESKETPGLGDKIEKDPDFLANFAAFDVSLSEDGSAVRNKAVTVKNGTKENPWEVDGITGATISSRAIGNIIAASTGHWVPLIYKNQQVFVQKNDK